MDNQELEVTQPNSVEISINGKGLYSGKVKCYGTTPEEAMNKAKEKAQELEFLIASKNQ